MRRSDRLIYFVASALSAVVLTAMFVVGFVWHDVRKLQANELGDWLSGFASTLAFIWLVAGFNLQRQQLNAQREEFRRAAIVSCGAEARELVLSTVQAEVASFKSDFPQYADWNIGFAFLTHMVIRKHRPEPTGCAPEDAVSDEALAAAIYAIDICTEAMYQACKMYLEVVHGEEAIAPHVSSISKRSKFIVGVIDNYKLPYISRFRIPLAAMFDREVDKFVSKHDRIFN